MRSLFSWYHRARQYLYCYSHVGDCEHCRGWKNAKIRARRGGPDGI